MRAERPRSIPPGSRRVRRDRLLVLEGDAAGLAAEGGASSPRARDGEPSRRRGAPRPDGPLDSGAGSMVLLAFSLQDQVEKYGAYVGIAAFFGLAVLSLLYFAQAREVKRLREWAGRAPERAAEIEASVVSHAEEARRTPAPAPAPPQPAAVPPVQPPAPAARTARSSSSRRRSPRSPSPARGRADAACAAPVPPAPAPAAPAEAPPRRRRPPRSPPPARPRPRPRPPPSPTWRRATAMARAACPRRPPPPRGAPRRRPPGRAGAARRPADPAEPARRRARTPAPPPRRCASASAPRPAPPRRAALAGPPARRESSTRAIVVTGWSAWSCSRCRVRGRQLTGGGGSHTPAPQPKSPSDPDAGAGHRDGPGHARPDQGHDEVEVYNGPRVRPGRLDPRPAGQPG